jgi:hypothetical protein
MYNECRTDLWICWGMGKDDVRRENGRRVANDVLREDGRRVADDMLREDNGRWGGPPPHGK